MGRITCDQRVRSVGMIESNPVVCRLWRGPAVESLHRGAWVAVDTHGTVIGGAGDPDQSVFPRSSTKPFQALPLLTSGAAEAAGFDDGDVALAMASHSGEAVHVARVLATLDRLGLTEDDLQCGPQRPLASWSEVGTRRAAMGCSGKHVGFLALARFLGTETADYLRPDSAVQQAIFAATGSVVGIGDDIELATAIDGCSAPTFRMPLQRLATGIARVANPAGLGAETAAAAERLVAAARAHPELVGGSRQRFDTDLIRATDGRLFTKGGAEGVLVVGVVGQDIGYALKIDDGSERPIPALVIDLLAAHGHLTHSEREQLAAWDDRTRRNADGLDTGRLEIADAVLVGARSTR